MGRQLHFRIKRVDEKKWFINLSSYCQRSFADIDVYYAIIDLFQTELYKNDCNKICTIVEQKGMNV